MTLRHRGTLGGIVLTIALAGLAGPASAGNGHGNGNANGNSEAAPAAAPASPSTSSPGNSANAPGQEKKSASGQDASVSPGQDKKSSPPAHGTSVDSPAPAGVKPMSTTAKNTNAPAASNATKRYGNGTTAGRIAMQNGYPATGNLHGPGNSQPHKVVTCGRRHGVDVHALKSHPASETCTKPVPSEHTATEVPSTSASHPASTDSSVPSSTPHPAAIVPHQSSTAVVRRSSDPQGVLEAVATFGPAELPFTGFPIWGVSAVAFALILLGLALRGPRPARVMQPLKRPFGTERRG